MSVNAEQDLSPAQQARVHDEFNSASKVLNTYDGRAFVWALLTETGIHRTSFVGEFPMTMAYNEGCRKIGIWVENWLFTIDNKLYIMMREEAEEREQRYFGLEQNTGNEDD